MKSIKINILVLLILLFLKPEITRADHFLGGEITWTCLGSGQYKFNMVYYRDCGGQSGLSSIQLQTSVPGIPMLSLYLFAQLDLSPNGYQANGDSSCLNCSDGTLTSWSSASLIEKYNFESFPITLPGIPPPGGWVFWYDECCRNTIANNVNYAGQLGYMRLEARMFPTLNQIAGICDDSSPVFVESPSFMSCIGINKELQHLAIDSDGDFVVYEFTSALADSGLVLPMQSGYTVSQPLPGNIQNPNNFVTNMNMFNGEVRLNSFTNGRFVLNVKVSSFRDAVKVSEIRRSYDLIITANCNPLSGNALNIPPVWKAPFFDTATASFSLYEDTVFAVDVVNFSKSILEFDMYENGTYQDCIFTVAGSQFGANFNSSTTGCLIPPCATIDIAVPDTFLLAQIFVFNWQTSTAHLNTFGWNPAKTYFFLFRASDNYCPVNASNARIVSITVMDSTVGIETLNSEVQFNISPNPAKDGIYTIDFKNSERGNFPLLVTTINGQSISSARFHYSKIGSKGILDLSSLSSGIYILRIADSVNRIVKL